MKALYVLYDAHCALCQRCLRFLSSEPQLVPVRGLSRDGPEAAFTFPELDVAQDDDLVVVSDEGAVYRGPDAFIVCLWALTRYRVWAHRLARPALRPLARAAFDSLSGNRAQLSRLFRGGDEQVVQRLRAVPVHCDDGGCMPAERQGGHPRSKRARTGCDRG